jgi:hypothetical protein
MQPHFTYIPQKRNYGMTLVCQALRWSGAVLFLAAATAKIHSPGGFWRALSSISWLAEGWVDILGMLIITLEVAAAILLSARSTCVIGAILAASLFSVFLVYAAWMHLDGKEGSCGCYPAIGWPRTYAGVLLLDSCGLAASIVLIRSASRSRNGGAKFSL